MFTTQTIISLVAARVLAIQIHGHSGGDDRDRKGSEPDSDSWTNPRDESADVAKYLTLLINMNVFR